MSEIMKSLKAWNSFASGGPRPEGPPVRCEEAANEVELLEQRISELERFCKAVIRYAGNAGDDYLSNKARELLEMPR